ncbi:uncharacterized protein RAG0_06075 [Rhynchosporium agropyri]|uniref:Uncharacterized protein n=1 Tax=Rhynchosporium agropyri TaxID=914238 RepID=A0A1E1KFY7_9HELO|nr:uncharacterized protein RAG0_06075 [Rhynchosporium agropyri]
MAHQTSKNDDSHWNAFLSGSPSNRHFTKNENENHELNDNSGVVEKHAYLKADDGDLISQTLHKALKDGQQDLEPDVEAVLGSMAAADKDSIISDFDDNAAVEEDEFVAPASPDDGLIRAKILSHVSESNASSTSACGLVVPTSSTASPIISEDESSPPNRPELTLIEAASIHCYDVEMFARMRQALIPGTIYLVFHPGKNMREFDLEERQQQSAKPVAIAVASESEVGIDLRGDIYGVEANSGPRIYFPSQQQIHRMKGRNGNKNAQYHDSG